MENAADRVPVGPPPPNPDGTAGGAPGKSNRPTLPHGWHTAYLRQPWDRDRGGCAALVCDVERDVFGVEIELPGADHWRRNPDPAMVAEYGTPTDSPDNGDIALMRLTGNQRSFGSHVGVCVMVDGHPWILHSLWNTGSVLTPPSSLWRTQHELVGWYRPN